MQNHITSEIKNVIKVENESDKKQKSSFRRPYQNHLMDNFFYYSFVRSLLFN